MKPNFVVCCWRGIMTADMRRAFDETREQVRKLLGEKEIEQEFKREGWG